LTAAATSAVVARADVEDVAIERAAQRLGAGERTDEGHLLRGEDRFRRVRRRRADVAEEQEDTVVDELLGIGRRAVRLVAVVERAQLDPASVDAAGGIDQLEVGERARAHLGAERLRRPGERGGLADDDRIRRDAGVG